MPSAVRFNLTGERDANDTVFVVVCLTARTLQALLGPLCATRHNVPQTSRDGHL